MRSPKFRKSVSFLNCKKIRIIVFVQYLEAMNFKNMLESVNSLSNIFAGELIDASKFQIECIELANETTPREKILQIENFFAQNIHAKFSIQNNNVFFQSTHVVVLWLLCENRKTVVGCIHYKESPALTTEANIYEITSICGRKKIVGQCTHFWHYCKKHQFIIVCHMLQFLKEQAETKNILWIEIALKSSSKLLKMLQNENFFIAGVRGKQNLQKTYHLLCMDWDMPNYALTINQC